jgi:phosphatidate cytidylyltransferase
LILRVRSALVLLPPLAAAAIAGGMVWSMLVAIAAAVASLELYDLARQRGVRPTRLVGPPLAAALVFSASPTAMELTRPLLAAGLLAAFAAQIIRPADERSGVDWAMTLVGPLYVGILLGYGVLLRGLPGGLGWTVLLIVMVWSNDSAAYLVGRRLGHTPMAPSLSPKKTWEGALACAIASLLIGVLAPVVAAAGPQAVAAFSAWAVDTAPADGTIASTPWWALASVGVVLAVVAPLGDLAKSFLKRQAGVKDAGQLIPGHGGIVDRVDSLLFAAPVVYYAALAFRP